MTRVVNLRRESYDVFIGRGSEWGNGYTHKYSMHPDVIAVVGSVEEAVERYRQDLWKRLQVDSAFFDSVAALHGKTLGCYCKPKPCHGDPLARAADWCHTMIINHVREPERSKFFRTDQPRRH